MKMVLTSEFPTVAPKGYFVTKIYHPNVSEKGEICVNTLKKDWNARGWSLYNVYEVICLIFDNFNLGDQMSSYRSIPGKFFK